MTQDALTPDERRALIERLAPTYPFAFADIVRATAHLHTERQIRTYLDMAVQLGSGIDWEQKLRVRGLFDPARWRSRGR